MTQTVTEKVMTTGIAVRIVRLRVNRADLALAADLAAGTASSCCLTGQSNFMPSAPRCS